MRAYLHLRHGTGHRLFKVFATGLESLGFDVADELGDCPAHCDILISWNLPAHVRRVADRYSTVLVVENASWGNEFAGDKWVHMASRLHNTLGRFPVGGPERWDALGVNLAPWRTSGSTLIFAQRGIGPEGVKMPPGWAENAQRRHGGRIRPHPGREPQTLVPLDEELATAGRAITWGSGAAIKALMQGVPVTSEMPGWIGEQDNTDAGRLAMFRRLAWAQWRPSEIETGEPIRRLMNHDTRGRL